jgi:uncharacterized membrane protein affecting hemolysin expression
MSEESTPPPAPESNESKRMDPRLRSVIIAALTLLLFIIVIFSSNVRANQIRISELERSVDAMSEALEPNVIADSPEKLQRIITDVAKAGNYKEVSVSDNSGKIIATTNSARLGTQSPAMTVSTKKAKAEMKDGTVVVRRAIILAGDTRYGNLEIRVTP